MTPFVTPPSMLASFTLSWRQVSAHSGQFRGCDSRNMRQWRRKDQFWVGYVAVVCLTGPPSVALFPFLFAAFQCYLPALSSSPPLWMILLTASCSLPSSPIWHTTSLFWCKFLLNRYLFLSSHALSSVPFLPPTCTEVSYFYQVMQIASLSSSLPCD